jgi:hypothetical protein
LVVLDVDPFRVDDEEMMRFGAFEGKRDDTVFGLAATRSWA